VAGKEREEREDGGGWEMVGKGILKFFSTLFLMLCSF